METVSTKGSSTPLDVSGSFVTILVAWSDAQDPAAIEREILLALDGNRREGSD